MHIRPTRSEPGRAGETARRRAAETRPDVPSRAKPQLGVVTGGRARDQIEISPAARKLAGLVGPESSREGTLDPARQRQILDRIASGFYDRGDVRAEVLNRILGDLEDGPDGS